MKRILTLALAVMMCLISLSVLADGEKTTVTIWSKDRHDAEYVQKKIDEYNATNTDNIEVVYQLYTDNYIQAVDMAVQNGEVPDVLVYQEQVFSKYYLNGQYADLNQFLTDEEKAYFADVIIDGYNQYDGNLYFIPTTGTTCRLFYNKEIFDRVGITEPPTTLEQVVEYAKKITAELGDEGIYGFAQNMKSASSALNRSLMVGMQREAGLVYGFDFAKGEYDFMPYAEALKLWTELLSEECAFPGCEVPGHRPAAHPVRAGQDRHVLLLCALRVRRVRQPVPDGFHEVGLLPDPDRGRRRGRQAVLLRHLLAHAQRAVPEPGSGCQGVQGDLP